MQLSDKKIFSSFTCCLALLPLFSPAEELPNQDTINFNAPIAESVDLTDKHLVTDKNLTSSMNKSEEDAIPVPISFVRDVMQPFGMPVVTFFHAIRESIFLNTKTTNASALESLGNFFLLPNQYLFAGKTIHVRDKNQPDIELMQSFNYQSRCWHKTLLSLIALPIFEPIGISIKGLSYLSSEVRQRHNKIKKAIYTPLINPQCDVYHQKGITTFYCDEYIPCQKHKRPSSLTKKQKIEIQALKDISSLLEAHQVLYWIDFGTCLGAYRYGGIIPWDWDIDLAIFEEDHDNVKKLLATLDPEKYQIQDWSSYSQPKTLLKLYVKETKNFIDIYHYKIDIVKKTLTYVYTYKDSAFPDSWKRSDQLPSHSPLAFDQVFPLKKANFDGLTVWAPNHVVNFLHTKYGDNLDPSMLWDEETMTYTKVEDHPYWAHIN